MNVQSPQTKRPDIRSEIEEERVWNFVDRVLVDSLSREIAQKHLRPTQTVELTALSLKQMIPQPEHCYQNTFLSNWSVSIAETVGTDVISESLEKTQRMTPSKSVKQFSYKQAVLCISCFIAKELDAYLSNSPDDANRIFSLAEDIKFSRQELIQEAHR
ncbi:hypothetical protein AV929_15605 [Haloarcula sp. K1]|nr:hypothetical protein AV929_15605 [Haloarcula sp. K1]